MYIWYCVCVPRLHQTFVNNHPLICSWNLKESNELWSTFAHGLEARMQIPKSNASIAGWVACNNEIVNIPDVSKARRDLVGVEYGVRGVSCCLHNYWYIFRTYYIVNIRAHRCFLDMYLFIVHLYANEMIRCCFFETFKSKESQFSFEILSFLIWISMHSIYCTLPMRAESYYNRCILYWMRCAITDKYALQPSRNMGPCQDSRWHRKPADYPTKSMLCAPVLLEGKVVAVIQLLNKRLGLQRVFFFVVVGGVGNTATDGGCWGYCNLELLNTWTCFLQLLLVLSFLLLYYFLNIFKYTIPYHYCKHDCDFLTFLCINQ